MKFRQIGNGRKKFLQFSIAFVPSASGALEHSLFTLPFYHFLFVDSKVLYILKFGNESDATSQELTGEARSP